MRARLPGWISGRDATGRSWEPAGRWGLYRSCIRSYMDRIILKTPWGTLRLHWILREDRGLDHHDHPFDFASFVLRGGYWEVLAGDGRVRWFGPGSLVQRRAEQAHTIVRVHPRTLTLVLSGPKRRDWGFLTPAGWRHHRDWRGER